MRHDTIQMRTAVQMFIDFLLEHREELEKAIEEKKQQEVQQEQKNDKAESSSNTIAS
ncbi:MAG: hypothetical protein AAF702_38070 [Chloroflexota bacterium]